MKNIFLTFLALILAFPSFADSGRTRVEAAIQDLLATTHKEIIDDSRSNFKITLFEIKSDEYFFISNLSFKRALFGTSHYRIGYNPSVFKNGISDLALKGVLAHELMHTNDYVHGSTLATILPIGIKVSFSKSRIQYERKTDLKVILKGLGAELIAYRQWQYPLLSEEALQKKKKEYLTPEEILYIMEIQNEFPALMQKWLKKKIPRNLDEMRKAVEKFNV